MTKLDILFIRACKSKSPRKRLISVHRRFYLLNMKDQDRIRHIVIILARLCDNYLPMTIERVLSDCLKKEILETEEEAKIENKVFRIVLNQIRFANGDKFPGFIPPIHFRR